MQTIILVVFAYLCGSIPFGKIFGLLKGIDIQKRGSGNIGFANAVRVLGWPLGVAVLVGDVLKGFIPVYIANNILGISGNQILLIGLAPIIGHAFPIWLKFRGGKSIATGLGVTAVISPVLAVCGILTYLIAFSVIKKSAPSSLIGTWLLPIYAVFTNPQLVNYFVILALFATYTHRSNIKQFTNAKFN